MFLTLVVSAPGLWPGSTQASTPAEITSSVQQVHQLVVRSRMPIQPPFSSPAVDVLTRSGATRVETANSLPGVYKISYPTNAAASGALRTLQLNPLIVWAEPDSLLQYNFDPGDPLTQEQAWIEAIDLHAAWNISTGSSSVVVAVVDSGVSETHPDLHGKLLPGYDFLNDHANPVDEVGHGTAVAGIIAARGNDGVGIAGVAMDTMILPVKVGSLNGSPISAIAAGIVWSVDQDADVINLSLGADFPSDALNEAVLYAYDQGVPVVAAAGNEPDAISYPGGYSEAISVGASTSWGTLTSFTSRANRVDLVAPGTGILTSWTGGEDGDAWATVSGTSFAAPMVTGVIALLLALDDSLSIEDLRHILIDTSLPIGQLDPEPGAGAGQLDAGAALSSFLARNFDKTWLPTDNPVASGSADRTWLWGPGPIATGFEPYDQATHGKRLIRYYDKARMEITDPGALGQDAWFVTNGLLARELISGRMQVGDQAFVDRVPARIVVAGDFGDSRSPTYADFRSKLNADPASEGATLTQHISLLGRVQAEDRFAEYGVTAAWYVPETNHQIASVFWSYLNSQGLIDMSGELVMGPIFHPTFYATGLPITEAYWTTVPVDGEMTDVLVQCFERRCLTYTPDNPEHWQVEMGNVGQHYFNWRYSEGSVSSRQYHHRPMSPWAGLNADS